MKEFMLFIKAEGNPVAALSEERQAQHVEKVGGFIQQMMTEGKMTAAQPLEMEGTIITGSNGKFKDGPFNEAKEVVAGYYLIVAKDLEEAVGIAKSDPRFEDGDWAIEVRPVMKVDGIN